jgi:4'-phosphopantetheinyl transferase
MPIENINTTAHSIWALWKIEEDEPALAGELYPYESIPDNLTHAAKRLEYLAGRVLIKKLLEKWNLSFAGLRKDAAGKPFFINLDLHVSLSHSYPYVAAVIDRIKPVGIDLEQPKEKLLKIAPRVLNPQEFNDASHDITKHCVYWCAKETLIKIYGKRHLHLSKELAIDPFVLQKQGMLTGRILANDLTATFPLHYRVYDNFVVVVNI